MFLLRLAALLLTVLLPCAALADLPIGATVLSEAEQAAHLDRMQLLPWSGDGPRRLIYAFDVADDGRIALAFNRDSGSGRAQVGVYDWDGAFLWGFSYRTRNAHPVLLTADGALSLLQTERAVILEEGPVGLSVRGYASGPDGTQLINRLRQTSRIVGDDRFMLRLASPLSLGYSSLVRVAPVGQEQSLYEASGAGDLSWALPATVILGIAVILIRQVWISQRR